MADTTPDSSNKDMLSIVIRTVDENCKPRERLLNISECIDKTGIGMAKHIFETLLKKEINTSSLAFQSYDFASSMSGQFNGVQQKLSEIIGQQVPYIPCQDHRTNTAVEHSCRISIVIRDLYDTLEALYVFFNSSTKRFRQLKNKIKEVENSFLLKNLSKTRWTARAETIKAVNISFEPILSLLGEISTQKELDCVTKTKAYGLYKKMKSFDFIVSLFFMKNIMNKMKILTETLETPNLNLIDGITVIESTVTILEQINTNSTDMDNLIGSAENFALTLNIDPEQDFQLHHRRRLRPKKIDECTENEVTLDLKLFYRKEFKAVLDTLCNGLRDNVNAIKTSISPLYSIFCFPLNKNNLTSEAIQKAVTMFPPNSRPDVCALQSELEVFFEICKEKEIMSMDALTNVVIQYKKALKLTFSMCQLIVTAGYGVSANERAFSQLKIVKGALRTTMADERLNNLMLMKCEGDLINISNLKNVVDRWSCLKQRRIHVSVP